MSAASRLRLVALLCALLWAVRCVRAVSVVGGWTDLYSFPTVAALFNLDLDTSDVEPSATVDSDSTSIASLLSADVDFALTASPLTASQAAAHPNLTILPAMSEAVAVVYRVDQLALPAGASLVLSRTTLALIYAGNITNWSDPHLQTDNPTLKLPNASIVVAYQADSSAVSLTFTSALHSFLSSVSTYLSVSSQPSWPLGRYAASISGTGITGVAAAVGNTNHAIGFCTHSVALSYGNAVASLVNRVGHAVAPSTAGVSITLYAQQAATSTPLTAFTQLIDCWSQYCYPMVMTTYLLLDSTAAPRGCDVRRATLDFWTWSMASTAHTHRHVACLAVLGKQDSSAATVSVAAVLRCRYYSSPSAYSDIYGEWQVVALPSLLVSQMNVLSALQSAITCNGTQLSSSGGVAGSSSSSLQLPVNGPSRIAQSINALSDFHASASSSIVNFEYSVNTSPNALNWSQRTGGLSFLYKDEIAATTSVDSSQFMMLPSFITSVSLIYNNQLSPTVTLNSSVQLVIDFTVLIRIGQPPTNTQRTDAAMFRCSTAHCSPCRRRHSVRAVYCAQWLAT